MFGKKALRTGLAVGQDVLEGKNLKESISKRYRYTYHYLLSESSNFFVYITSEIAKKYCCCYLVN